jgi:chemotaxis protein methyltransferase CheR
MSELAPASAAVPARRPDKAGERELSFGNSDFERVRKLIHDHAGISLCDSKRDMVYGRLSRLLRQRGLDRFSDYLDNLESANDPAHWQDFVNALTTNLTAFFRESHHFDILRQHLAGQRRTPLTLWCAAASTGEEPYSLAMTVAEHYGSLKPPVRILATDIDTQVLETGARGVYPMDRVEKLAPDRLRRFFLKGRGANAGQCRVIDDLRALITFRRLNLLEDAWPLRGPFTAIFCRNVMIYFDKTAQRRMLTRMMPLLADDGIFVAGHSESLLHCNDLLRLAGRTVYHKVRSP